MSSCSSGANQILTLSVPSEDNKFGTALDVSTLSGEKTVTLSGVYDGQFSVFGSHDGISYVPVLTFDAGTGVSQAKLTFSYVLKYLKLFRKSRTATNISVKVSSQESCSANNFVTLPVIPARAEGAQASTDLNSVVPPTGLNPGFTAIVNGNFSGTIILEGSLDNANFNPIGQNQSGESVGGFQSYPPSVTDDSPLLSPITSNDTVRYIRLNVAPGTFVKSAVTVTLGGSQNVSCLSSGNGMRVFATVAEMTAAGSAGAFNNQSAILLGYYSRNDGGDGDVYWDSASIETPNLGTIFQVTGTTTGRWKRLYANYFLADWFGPVKDGTTNDYTRLNACLVAANAVGVKDIEFSAATYAHSPGLAPAAGQALIGSSGRRGTTLKKIGNGDQITLVSQCSLQDITLNANGANYTGRGIYVASGFQLNIENVDILTSEGIALEFALNAGSGTKVEHFTASTTAPNSVACIYAPADGTGACPVFFSDIHLTDGIFDFSNALGRAISLTDFYISQFRFNTNSQVITIGIGRCRTENGTGVYSLTLSGGQVLMSSVDFGGRLDLVSAQEFKLPGCSYTGITEDITTCQYNDYNKYAATYVSSWFQSGGVQPALGNGTFVCFYSREGTVCTFVGRLVMGTTSSYGNNAFPYRFNLPLAGTFQGDQRIVGALITDPATNTQYSCLVIIGAAETTFTLAYNNGGVRSDSPPAPFVWASGVIIDFEFSYIVR